MSQYELYQGLLKGYKLPQAVVDMDRLDENLYYLLNQCPDHKIRLASKSMRSIEILKYVKSKLGEKCSGIMAFHPQEAKMLVDEGFKNILLAYPYTLSSLFENYSENHLDHICFMIDHSAHLQVLEDLGKKHGKLVNVCIDIDMSVNLKIFNFGVYRSSLKNMANLKDFIGNILKCKHIKVIGLMGYEAQIAGLADKNPYTFLNPIFRLLKSISIPVINKRREKMVHYLREHFNLLFVNGGGTASLKSTTKDKSVTEVTIGSGFYCPQLFSYYRDLSLQPAAFFALEITRKPAVNYYTCAGGGYIASGSPSWDKVPKPFLPLGGKLTSNEACGEVQTPIYYPGHLNIGDPFFFRHSKAGEMCERFNQLILIKDKKVFKVVSTYRGAGFCFL